MLCTTLVACQPAELPLFSDPPPIHVENKTIPDLNELCSNIDQEMLKINQQRTIFALQEINQDLKVCLPLMTTKEQFNLLNISTKMYQNFLHVERTPEQETAFQNYMITMGSHPTIQQKHFQKMTLRDQYLVKHQGQAYIEVTTQIDQYSYYRRHPQYLARIFAPYLPKTEQTFILALADQNAQPIFNGDHLNLEPATLVERALFWENYIQNYPQSRYLQDAKQLYHIYGQLLFIGNEQARLSDTYDGENTINKKSLIAIQHLAKQPHSPLAKQAKRFLSFVHRDTAYKKYTFNPIADRPLHALQQYLGITPISLKNQKKCLNEAICL